MKKKKLKKHGGKNLNTRSTIEIKNPNNLAWHENILLGIKQIIDPSAAYQQLENNDEEGLYEINNRYDFTSTVITIIIAIFFIGLIIISIYLLFRYIRGQDVGSNLSKIFAKIDTTISPLESIHNDPNWPTEYYERNPLDGNIKLNDNTNKPSIFNPLDETEGPVDNKGTRTNSNWKNFTSKFDELAFIFNQPGGGNKSSNNCMQLRQAGGVSSQQNFNIPPGLLGPSSNSTQVINPNWESKNIISIDKIKNLTGTKLINKIQSHFASFTYNKFKYITFKLDKQIPQPSVLFDNIKEIHLAKKFF